MRWRVWVIAKVAARIAANGQRPAKLQRGSLRGLLADSMMATSRAVCWRDLLAWAPAPSLPRAQASA
eukprot:2915944-Alexandrium_andersonii.AAC.1